MLEAFGIDSRSQVLQQPTSSPSTIDSEQTETDGLRPVFEQAHFDTVTTMSDKTARTAPESPEKAPAKTKGGRKLPQDGQTTGPPRPGKTSDEMTGHFPLLEAVRFKERHSAHWTTPCYM